MYNSRQKGNEYEEIAAEYLKNKGYMILDRNYRINKGEIDIVAKDGEYIVFIEVKYRHNFNKGYAEEAVDIRKQRQISDVSIFYLNSRGYGTDISCRYDVITVSGNKTINHIENAFNYCGRYR
ncbi:MAG: YraN family protein [Coprococcus sp.]